MNPDETTKRAGKSIAIIMGVGLAICALAIIGAITFVLVTWIVDAAV